jgi:hypothetical protein
VLVESTLNRIRMNNSECEYGQLNVIVDLKKKKKSGRPSEGGRLAVPAAVPETCLVIVPQFQYSSSAVPTVPVQFQCSSYSSSAVPLPSMVVAVPQFHHPSAFRTTGRYQNPS